MKIGQSMISRYEEQFPCNSNPFVLPKEVFNRIRSVSNVTTLAGTATGPGGADVGINMEKIISNCKVIKCY